MGNVIRLAFGTSVLLLIFLSLHRIQLLRTPKPDTSHNDKRVQEKRRARELKRQIHKQKLKDVVIPFTMSQLERVQERISSWADFPPCQPVQGNAEFNLQNEQFYYANPHVGYNITLTFAVSEKEDHKVREKILAWYHETPAYVKSCFSRVRVAFAGLSANANSYLKGSENMFFALLKNQFELDDPHYVLHIEPDVLPLRRFWLSAADAMTRVIGESFWIKGTLYRGQRRDVISALHYRLHLNGNAIIRVGDPEFTRFYCETLQAYIKTKKGACGYDSNLFLYLLDSANINTTERIAHKFQYSDLVQNMWRHDYDKIKVMRQSPNTYLIHGGRPIIE